jgi:hypothetical protein
MQALTEKSIEYLSEVPIEAGNGKIYHADLLIGKNLVVEVDGPSHTGRKWEKDRVRDEQLAMLGLITLRFSDQEVKNELSHVLKTIQQALHPETITVPLHHQLFAAGA